jgi:hypothetical protein
MTDPTTNFYVAILPYCENDGKVNIILDIGRQFYSPGHMILFGDAPSGPGAGFITMHNDSMRLHVCIFLIPYCYLTHPTAFRLFVYLFIIF